MQYLHISNLKNRDKKRGDGDNENTLVSVLLRVSRQAEAELSERLNEDNLLAALLLSHYSRHVSHRALLWIQTDDIEAQEGILLQDAYK